MESVEKTSAAGQTHTTVTVSSASQDDSSNLATAVAVETRPVVVADPVDKPNEEKKKSNTLAFVFFLVAIVVIVLAVVFSPSGKSKTDVIPTESSESTQTTPEGVDGSEPSMQTESYEQRRENMISVLEPLYEDSEGGVAVFDASSPFASQDRIDALEWLVKLDKANLQTAIPSDFNEQEVFEYEQILYQVRQRFIMALLYTATNGQDWTQQCNFLSESNECEWRNVNLLDDTKGVTCNDAGQIESLQLCKYSQGPFKYYQQLFTKFNVPNNDCHCSSHIQWFRILLPLTLCCSWLQYTHDCNSLQRKIAVRVDRFVRYSPPRAFLLLGVPHRHQYSWWIYFGTDSFLLRKIDKPEFSDLGRQLSQRRSSTTN